MADTHRTINPAILYAGTPVVLISTVNEDGTFNLAPMSSAWWLGNRCMLGLATTSQTTINLLRTKQCVLNLPSDDMVAHVNGIARTTGTAILPPYKKAFGYRFVKDKFGAAGLEPQASELVAPPRASGCPLQMEAELVTSHRMIEDVEHLKDFIIALEVRIVRVHAQQNIISKEYPNRIDPDKWRPLIMSFQKFYGLSAQLQNSILAEIDEENYRLLSDA